MRDIKETHPSLIMMYDGKPIMGRPIFAEDSLKIVGHLPTIDKSDYSIQNIRLIKWF